MISQLIFKCENKKVLSIPSNNIPRVGESVWINEDEFHRSSYKVVDVVYCYTNGSEEIVIDLKHEQRRVILDKGPNA